jgi:hypothetical protein
VLIGSAGAGGKEDPEGHGRGHDRDVVQFDVRFDVDDDDTDGDHQEVVMGGHSGP